MMTETELEETFEEIQRLGANIRPRSEYDSIVITACTQFNFVRNNFSTTHILDLCDRLINHLVTDSAQKRQLLHLVFKVRNDFDARYRSL